MIKNLRKKKKGFTLIELVIVLAVLAIIALIAIPNFNKVRTDSQKKADDATCETIKNITDMAIANQDMTISKTTNFTLTPKTSAKGVDAPSTVSDLVWRVDGETSYEASLIEVSKPQQKNKSTYKVTIDIDTTTKVESVNVITE